MRFIRRRFFALVATSFVAHRAVAFGEVRKVAKVAVLSVTGPADWQETIEVAETSMVAALRGKGLAVVPLADSKTFTAANWQAAYSNVGQGIGPFGKNVSAGQRASRNTLVLEDRLQRAGQRGYSATFCRTAGELARQMGADGAVLLTIGAGRTMHIVVLDQAGAYVFRRQVAWDSKEPVSAAIGRGLGHYPNGSE